jgi:hypothetical protein
MAVWRFVDFDRPETQRLADLTGIANDLEATEEICDLLRENLQKLPSSGRILEALSSAALVRYARAFVSGVRTPTPKSVVEDLPEALRKDHGWFIELRHKYVAHSVNTFEENQVVVYLVPEERGPKGVSTVEVQQRRLLSLGLDDTERLKNLASEVRARVAALIVQERQKVLEFARALPADDFYKQLDPPLKVATPKDVDKSRRRK